MRRRAGYPARVPERGVSHALEEFFGAVREMDRLGETRRTVLGNARGPLESTIDYGYTVEIGIGRKGFPRIRRRTRGKAGGRKKDE